MFIPDPEALDEGTTFLRDLRFRLKLDDGTLCIPRVRVEHRAPARSFQVKRKKRRLYVPLVRSARWAHREAMKRSFSLKIRDIIVMISGVRGHMNLTMWRESDNLMKWHGECADCHTTFSVGPGYWRRRPGLLWFRGMAFVDDCPTPQAIRRIERRAPPEPFSRLLSGRR